MIIPLGAFLYPRIESGDLAPWGHYFPRHVHGSQVLPNLILKIKVGTEWLTRTSHGSSNLKLITDSFREF